MLNKRALILLLLLFQNNYSFSITKKNFKNCPTVEEIIATKAASWTCWGIVLISLIGGCGGTIKDNLVDRELTQETLDDMRSSRSFPKFLLDMFIGLGAARTMLYTSNKLKYYKNKPKIIDKNKTKLCRSRLNKILETADKYFMLSSSLLLSGRNLYNVMYKDSNLSSQASLLFGAFLVQPTLLYLVHKVSNKKYGYSYFK